MKRPRLYLFLLWIAAVTAHPGSGLCQDLSDAQKRAVVYDMYEDYRKSFPAVPSIPPSEAMALLDAGQAVFVDAREPVEVAVSRIPGAVTEEAFLQSPDAYAGKTVIGYCTISYRSGLLAQQLAERGIIMHNLAGGILAWTLEGGRVVDSKGATVQRIHVYGPKWNFPPKGYEAVMFGILRRWNP
jgi:rhodanese-related sulfurtransferase